jgi:uncharacterized membrane protein YraQ (UPF0718 family)
MFVPTLTMAVVAIALIVLGYVRGQGEHIAGMHAAFSMLITILPLLFFSFLVAGLAQSFLTGEFLARWVGSESGMRGILIGTIAGGLAPGGPYVSMPIAAGLLRTGAGIGTMVAFMTGWSLWAVTRLPIEVGFIGWKITLIRLASTFLFPPIAGFIAQSLFGQVKFF